jgi:hypothetical protein
LDCSGMTVIPKLIAPVNYGQTHENIFDAERDFVRARL